MTTNQTLWLDQGGLRVGANQLTTSGSGVGVGTSSIYGSFTAGNSAVFFGNVGIGTITPTTALSVNGTVTDAIGNLRDLVNHIQTVAYVLAATDNGKMINITTGGVTVNSNIFSAGNNLTIYNNSAVSQTITQGTNVTMYLAGTATTGNRTLSQRGLATIVCVAANTFAISGSGIS